MIKKTSAINPIAILLIALFLVICNEGPCPAARMTPKGDSTRGRVLVRGSGMLPPDNPFWEGFFQGLPAEHGMEVMEFLVEMELPEPGEDERIEPVAFWPNSLWHAALRHEVLPLESLGEIQRPLSDTTEDGTWQRFRLRAAIPFDYEDLIYFGYRLRKKLQLPAYQHRQRPIPWLKEDIKVAEAYVTTAKMAWMIDREYYLISNDPDFRPTPKPKQTSPLFPSSGLPVTVDAMRGLINCFDTCVILGFNGWKIKSLDESRIYWESNNLTTHPGWVRMGYYSNELDQFPSRFRIYTPWPRGIVVPGDEDWTGQFIPVRDEDDIELFLSTLPPHIDPPTAIIHLKSDAIHEDQFNILSESDHKWTTQDARMNPPRVYHVAFEHFERMAKDGDEFYLDGIPYSEFEPSNIALAASNIQIEQLLDAWALNPNISQKLILIKDERIPNDEFAPTEFISYIEAGYPKPLLVVKTEDHSFLLDLMKLGYIPGYDLQVYGRTYGYHNDRPNVAEMALPPGNIYLRQGGETGAQRLIREMKEIDHWEPPKPGESVSYRVSNRFSERVAVKGNDKNTTAGTESIRDGFAEFDVTVVQGGSTFNALKGNVRPWRPDLDKIVGETVLWINNKEFPCLITEGMEGDTPVRNYYSSKCPATRLVRQETYPGGQLIRELVSWKPKRKQPEYPRRNSWDDGFPMYESVKSTYDPETGEFTFEGVPFKKDGEPE